VRDDEGTRSEVPMEIESAAKVDELKRMRAWQLEQWRSHP
jgi:hypothetical protein